MNPYYCTSSGSKLLSRTTGILRCRSGSGTERLDHDEIVRQLHDFYDKSVAGCVIHPQMAHLSGTVLYECIFDWNEKIAAGISTVQSVDKNNISLRVASNAAFSI